MGVVTGIVQEFQFGMNWSEYSRFVGDVFGAPLALEGLLAFFFEATFIGLWIFGWDKLPARPPPRHHLGDRRSAASLSAYFIIAANAFMQNPVGYEMNAEQGPRRAGRHRGRCSRTRWRSRPSRTRSSPSFMVAAGLIISASAWHLARNQHLDTMRPALKFGLWTMVGAGILTTLFGDQLSLAMVATQPMKMAAAEATYDTVCGADASFSLFTLGTPDGTSELFSIRIPYLLSFLSTHTFDGMRRGHQRPAGAVPGAVRSRRLHARSSGSPTGRSAG